MLHSENESLKSKLAQGSLGDVMDQVAEVKGVKLLAAKVEGVDMNGLRDLGESAKKKLGEGVCCLAAVNGAGKPCHGYRCSSKAGAHAGNRSRALPSPPRRVAAAVVRIWLRPAERTRKRLRKPLTQLPESWATAG